MLLALPEYKVDLPGGSRPSQNDIFVLGRDGEGHLLAMMIEGKVSESFGPTLTEWNASQSAGKQQRLAYIQKELGLSQAIPGAIRYQLLHRAVSAVIEARRFNAKNALMVVHSFSQQDEWFEDYQRFVALFGVNGCGKGLVKLSNSGNVQLYSGWATGSGEYLKA